VTKVLVAISFLSSPFFWQSACVCELWSVHMCVSMLVSIICVHVDELSKLFGAARQEKRAAWQAEI